MMTPSWAWVFASGRVMALTSLMVPPWAPTPGTRNIAPGMMARRALVSSGELVAPMTAPTWFPMAVIILATAEMSSGVWSSAASGFEVLQRAKTPMPASRNGWIEERPIYGEQVMKSASIVLAPAA